MRRSYPFQISASSINLGKTSQLTYNNKQRKKKVMFNNILQKNKKRHNTLSLSKDNINVQEKSCKSIEYFKINQLVALKNMQEASTIISIHQKKRTISHFNLRDRESSQIKIIQKPTPLRLERASRQATKIIESTANSFVDNQPSGRVRSLIYSQILPKMMEHQVTTQYNSSSLHIKTDNLAKIVHKTCLLFLEADHSEEEFPYLNEAMRAMKEQVQNRNKAVKSDRNKINARTHFFNEFKIYSNSIYESKDDIRCIMLQKNTLLQELSDLQLQKKQVLQHNISKMKQIEQENQQISQKQRQIDELQSNLSKVRCDLIEEGKKLQSITAQTDHIFNFVERQTKNKLVQMASEQYKLIESEIYEYAVYLQANELANSLDYESLPVKYFKSLIQTVEASLKDINREILRNQEMSLEEKGKLMRDFILRMHDAYQKKDCEVQKSIQFKTKCIIKFVDMMKKWLDNWTLKQEYLVNLRKSFAADSIAFEERLALLKNHIEASQPSLLSNDTQALASLYSKLKENYLLGNSFY